MVMPILFPQDVLNGKEGNDKIYGLLKADTLNGGYGNGLYGITVMIQSMEKQEE